MTVKDIMKKDPVTIDSDITVERAVATAQERGVGALPVMEGDVVVGIITTNDFFYKILNPLLGINENGRRVLVYGADTPDQICKVMDAVKESGSGIKAIHTIAFPEAASRDLIVHIESEDAKGMVEKLKGMGFHVEEREHEAL